MACYVRCRCREDGDFFDEIGKKWGRNFQPGDGACWGKVSEHESSGGRADEKKIGGSATLSI